MKMDTKYFELADAKRDGFFNIGQAAEASGVSAMTSRRAIALESAAELKLDLPGLAHLYEEFNDMPVVSISNAQRRPLPDANWYATVHHGIDPSGYCPTSQPRGDYLAFLGRIA